MINLVVVSLRGSPLGRAVSAQFGAAGGSIGRAATNTLVLDDPDRTATQYWVRSCLLPTALLRCPMSRPLRIEFPGAVYHVTSRGDRREPIYRDDNDRLAQLDVIAHAMRVRGQAFNAESTRLICHCDAEAL